VAGADALAVEVRADISGASLSRAITEAVYRIAVEAITNTARHADAELCTVHIVALDKVTVEVCDDGRGLPEPVRAGGSARWDVDIVEHVGKFAW
jgi:two-component system NarL family sensor kinase